MHRHAFVEFLDFLEVYSAAINAKLFSEPAHEMVRDKIADSIVVLERVPHWHDEIQEAITSPAVYTHLARFIHKHRRYIDSLKGSS